MSSACDLLAPVPGVVVVFGVVVVVVLLLLQLSRFTLNTLGENDCLLIGKRLPKNISTHLEVVVPAEELALPQCEFLSRHELLVASHAAEAVEVEYLALGAHHVVGLPERSETLVTFCAEEPVEEKKGKSIYMNGMTLSLIQRTTPES